MTKKLFLSFLIVIVIGISITGFFSAKVTMNSYLENLKGRLATNGRLISNIFIREYRVDEKNYDDLAVEFSHITNARITIIAANGMVIGESHADTSTMENHGERYEVKEALAGRIGDITRYSTTEKIDMMYIALPVCKGEVPLTVIRLAVPLTDIQKIQQYFLRYIVLAILVGVLGSSAIAYTIVKNITKPIKEMTYISSQIANGSYDRRININSKNELGQLEQTFNYMAEKLEITISDLSDKKNKLEAILKSMQSGVIAVDNIGRIMLVNPAAINMFGFNEDIMGRHILEVIRNMELEDIIYKHQDENREIKLNYPERRTLRVKSTRIRDMNRDDRKMGVVIVMQDITELKHLEQMRTEFVANVSHELKTPLTSIKGFAETLKSGAIKNDATREKFLDIIDIEADRLTRLINDILILSELENKRQNIPFEKININEAIEEIEEMMYSVARLKNINLVFHKEEGMPYVMSNHDKVKQLLINLIDNAIKYTHESGSVTVRSYCRDDQVYLEVSDTGIGISKEHIARLFERFYRVDKGRSRSLGGTGLGLAIVKHIVAAMGGSIKVNSELGVGTTFMVVIPKA